MSLYQGDKALNPFLKHADNHAKGASDEITPASIGAAANSHNHDASNITSGTLPIARGGTGITTAPAILTNLASTASASLFASAPRPGVTGVLPVANGGTGVTNLSALATQIGGTKIQTGSYVGTGTYGPSNPCSLTFNFVPLWIQFPGQIRYSIPSYYDSNGNGYHSGIFLTGITNSYQANFGVGTKRSMIGNGGYSLFGKMINTTYYWYLEAYNVTGDAASQYNASGTTYFYFALG